jgi:calcineurin-like phosphoesterase family protein
MPQDEHSSRAVQPSVKGSAKRPEIPIDEHLLILCHYPFRTWNKMGKKAVNLHGHSHGKLKPLPRQYDVGVDARGLRPVTLSQLLASR